MRSNIIQNLPNSYNEIYIVQSSRAIGRLMASDSKTNVDVEDWVNNEKEARRAIKISPYLEKQ